SPLRSPHPRAHPEISLNRGVYRLAPKCRQPIRGRSGRDFPFGVSNDFCSSRSLARDQKRLHELALAANSHAGKSFEPSAFRNFGLRIELISQLSELISGDLPTLIRASR